MRRLDHHSNINVGVHRRNEHLSRIWVEGRPKRRRNSTELPGILKILPDLAGPPFADAQYVLSRFVAALLIVLSASPFSAPFSTCGMATLVRSGRGQLNQPNAIAMDLRVTRDGNNSALVPLRPNIRTDTANLLLHSWAHAGPEPMAALTAAQTGIRLAGRQTSSPLRI